MTEQSKTAEELLDEAEENAKMTTAERYPGWDQERHKEIQGRTRFMGPSGPLPPDIMGEYWSDPRIKRQICHGLDVNNNEVWKHLPDKPLPGFVTRQAAPELDDDFDAPIPYDYELPPHAQAHVEVGNFDNANPAAGKLKVPASAVADETTLLQDFKRFIPNAEPNEPAVA